MPTARVDAVVTRTDVRLRPDPSRVIAKLFVPGEDLPSGASRAIPLIQRILAIPDGQVVPLLDSVLAAFEGRHVDLPHVLQSHFNEVGGRLGAGSDISYNRRALLGAYFTAEYSVEGAALCNPSMVPHPDQSDLDAGETRFVMSLRGVGEGHISSIEFRTGVVHAGGEVEIDVPSRPLIRGEIGESNHDKGRVSAHLVAAGAGGEIADVILDALPASFTGGQLEAVLATLSSHVLTRQVARTSIDELRLIAAADYTVSFPVDSRVDERILMAHGPTESHGMEDARFVRLTDDTGAVGYYATYTAFDGSHIAPQLLRTDDFRTFRVSQLSGPAATNKGMALFPRMVGGRFAALSRGDGDRSAFTTSEDGWRWERPVTIHVPAQPWELVQVGNCGSPIETPEGWLVLTHGVGPLRTYSIGAVLLDLDEPSRIRAALTTPLMVTSPGERDGYVPNVLYSCGGMRHGDTVVLPYAWGDIAISVAVIDLPGLLDCILRP